MNFMDSRLIKVLRNYGLVAEELGMKFVSSLLSFLRKGKSVTEAVKLAEKESKFYPGINAAVSDAVCDAALIGLGINTRAATEKSLEAAKTIVRPAMMDRAWTADGLNLSRRLHGAEQSMRTAVADTLSATIGKGKAVVDAARELYDGYTSGKAVLHEAELPNYLKRLQKAATRAVDGDPKIMKEFNAALKEAKRNIDAMARRGITSGAQNDMLKNAYKQFVTAAENLNLKAMERGAWVAVQEKARYHADRIAKTEAARAWADGFYANTLDKKSIVGYQWTLSSNHPRLDICDFYASADMYGMGPGRYPKDSVPVHPAHPHCRCTLQIVLKTEATPGEYRPGAGSAYLNKLDEFERQQLLGIEGNKRFMSGESPWQAVLNGWQEHENPYSRLDKAEAQRTKDTIKEK